MRLRRSCLVVVCVLALAACGSGSDNPNFGGKNSLNPDRQSISSLSIEERSDALLLAEANEIKTEVPPSLETEGLLLTQAGRASSDAALLSQFDMYPGHTISSRVIDVGGFVSRDTCLKKCVDTARCGGVTYAAGLICYIHGPTQSIDKLAPLVIKSKNGQVSFDTYIITARNLDYNEDGNVYLDVKADGAYRFKVLYADGTASAWKVPGLALVNETVPFKPLEGVVLSATNDDGVHFKFINVYGIKCYGDCSYPDFNYPLIAWNFSDYSESNKSFHLSTDCDDDVTDGCAPSVGMGSSIPNQNPPYNEFDTFGGDGESLSLSQLAAYTQRFVW